MAYLKLIGYICQHCKKRTATKELFNLSNVPCGKFCAACADIRLQGLQKVENGGRLEETEQSLRKMKAVY
jgi:hypothetical protein